MSITRVSTLSLDGGSLAVRVVGSGDRTPSEVDHRVEMEPTGPPHLWGKGQWRSATVFFIPILHTLLLCDFPNVPCSVPIFVRV